MNKEYFLSALRNKLSGLSQGDIQSSIEFYSEMIDERIEEGLTEEEAISKIGTVDEVATQIMSEIPFSRLIKEKVKPKRNLKALEIILLILGAPIWLSLLIALLAVILSVYIAIWSVIISLWAVAFSVAGCSLGGIIAFFIFVLQGNLWTGVAMLGAGLACIGLSILSILGCKLLTKGFLTATKKLLIGIKSLFIGKEKSK